MRAKALEPVTLVRSPMLTNSDPLPMVTGSRPDRRIGGSAGASRSSRSRMAWARRSDSVRLPASVPVLLVWPTTFRHRSDACAALAIWRSHMP
jgi:hypothetical protein